MKRDGQRCPYTGTRDSAQHWLRSGWEREEDSSSHIPVLVFYWLLRQPSSTAMKQNMEKVISPNGNPLNSESVPVYEVVCFYIRSEKLSGFYAYFMPTKLEKIWYRQLMLFPECIKSLRKLNFKFTVQTKILLEISQHLHYKQSIKIFCINFCAIYARFMEAILLLISQEVLC